EVHAGQAAAQVRGLWPRDQARRRRLVQDHAAVSRVVALRLQTCTTGALHPKREGRGMTHRDGMLSPLLNLDCNSGERWFSPTPNRWRGKACGHQTGIGKRGCELPLRRMKAWRER